MDNSQRRRVTSGLCFNCGKPRGPDGTTVRCRPCAKKASAAAVKRKSRIRAERRAKPQPPTSSKRACLSKQRKKLGLHLVSVLLSQEALDALVKLAFLQPEQRASRSAISDALSRFAYAKLVRDYEHTNWAIAARAEREATRNPPRRKSPKQPPEPPSNNPETPP
jgi:hypothetical protein